MQNAFKTFLIALGAMLLTASGANATDVTFYENVDGSGAWMTAVKGDIVNDLSTYTHDYGTYDNFISLVKVENNNTVVVVYDGYNLTGAYKELRLGVHNLASLGFNDRASSFEVMDKELYSQLLKLGDKMKYSKFVQINNKSGAKLKVSVSWKTWDSAKKTWYWKGPLEWTINKDTKVYLRETTDYIFANQMQISAYSLDDDRQWDPLDVDISEGYEGWMRTHVHSFDP